MNGVKHLMMIAGAAAVLAIPVTAAAPVTIRLATLAPQTSTWQKALVDMGDAWAKGTDGRVKLVVFAGGTQGSEPAVIKMMRPGVNQMQAGLFMIAGLSEIDDAFNAFGMPFFFQSDAEAQYVQSKLTPQIEDRLNKKGFHLLCWGSGGWVELFSKKQLKSLADVKAAKLYTSEGDDKMVQWYKSNGFHPVPLSANDIAAQLKLPNGMIEAAPSPAYVALVTQMFRDAKFMLNVHVAPLVGGLIITTDAWNKISPEDRQKMTDAAKAFESRLATETPKLDADSITQMQGRQLTVTTLDAKAAAEFHAEADRLVATMRNAMIPSDIFDMALKERDAFRKTKGK